jgi:hypothetical protein
MDGDMMMIWRMTYSLKENASQTQNCFILKYAGSDKVLTKIVRSFRCSRGWNNVVVLLH